MHRVHFIVLQLLALLVIITTGTKINSLLPTKNVSKDGVSEASIQLSHGMWNVRHTGHVPLVFMFDYFVGGIGIVVVVAEGEMDVSIDHSLLRQQHATQP